MRVRTIPIYVTYQLFEKEDINNVIFNEYKNRRGRIICEVGF
jgi:hypothetical protein